MTTLNTLVNHLNTFTYKHACSKVHVNRGTRLLCTLDDLQHAAIGEFTHADHFTLILVSYIEGPLHYHVGSSRMYKHPDGAFL